MAPGLPMPTLRALTVVDNELGRPRTDLWKFDLILTFLAYRAHRTLADLAQHRAANLNRLVDLLGNRPKSPFSVPLARLATGLLGISLRLPLGEGGGLAFATAAQLFDDLLQLSDPALLSGDPVAELRVFFQEFLVSWHV
jgi:hypothetical protein